MKAEECHCGQKILIDWRWNGLDHIPVFYIEHSEEGLIEIDNCPACGERILTVDDLRPTGTKAAKDAAESERDALERDAANWRLLMQLPEGVQIWRAQGMDDKLRWKAQEVWDPKRPYAGLGDIIKNQELPPLLTAILEMRDELVEVQHNVTLVACSAGCGRGVQAKYAVHGMCHICAAKRITELESDKEHLESDVYDLERDMKSLEADNE